MSINFQQNKTDKYTQYTSQNMQTNTIKIEKNTKNSHKYMKEIQRLTYKESK